jgi:hypothetical protein
MFNIVRGSLVAVLLAGTSLAIVVPASAAEVVGVHVGGIGVSVGSGHYYDAHHHRQAYSYPSDWKTYHHPQNWYRSHPSWNDSGNADYYRR